MLTGCNGTPAATPQTKPASASSSSLQEDIDSSSSSSTRMRVQRSMEWETYQGPVFSFAYPKTAKQSINDTVSPPDFTVEPPSLSSVQFEWVHDDPPFQEQPFDLDGESPPVCLARFFIREKEQFFVDISHGVLNTRPDDALTQMRRFFKNSTTITIDGAQGVRKNEPTRMPPGGGGPEDTVWVPHLSKTYLFSYDIDHEILSPDAIDACKQAQMAVFEALLSSFRFRDTPESETPSL